MVEEESISQGGFSGLAIGVSQGFQGGLGCSARHLHQDTVVFVRMHSVSLVRELGEDKNLYDQEKRLKNNYQWPLPVVKLGTCREMVFHTREEPCCINKEGCICLVQQCWGTSLPLQKLQSGAPPVGCCLRRK